MLEKEEQERLERERQERERHEREREQMEERRRLLERAKLDKQDIDKRVQEREARQRARLDRARKGHQEIVQRLNPKKKTPRRLEGQVLGREQEEGPQIPDLEEERRAEDQQRIGMDELLDLESEDDIVAGPGVQAEEVSNKTTVGINFRIRE